MYFKALKKKTLNNFWSYFFLGGGGLQETKFVWFTFSEYQIENEI